MSEKTYLGNLQTFDYKTQQWDIFQNRIKFFFKVYRITENQAAILLTYLSDDTYRLAQNLVHPKDVETLTFCEVVQTLNGHFKPRRSTFADSVKFYSAMKTVDESIEEWLAGLRGLDVHCAFGTALDRVLRDRFILGLPDGPARNKLFEQDASLTLDKALELAQQARSVAAPALGVKEEPVYRVSVAAGWQLEGSSLRLSQ